MKWETVTLDELGMVSRGRSKHRPRNDPSLFGGDYPFIQTADVKSAPFYINKFTETYNDKGLSQSKIWRKGTLCITIAANIADTAILDIDACFPDSVMGFIPYDGISDVRFVKYAFDMLQRDMKQISQGAAQDNLSWTKLSTIQFPKPPIEVQRKIADYLVVYEDTIENNKKQIMLLEEAAQRLYKEWFVDLRFPGHETTPIVDGMPKGWKIGEVSNIVEYFDKYRKPLSSNERINFKGEYKYYGASGVLDHVQEYLFDGVYLLFGEDGTVINKFGYPILQYVSGKFWANNHAHVLKGKLPFSTEFIYMLFSNMKVNDIVTGVAQPKISQARLSAKEILIPENNLVIEYQEKTKRIFSLIISLKQQIENVKEARDRLLPKLMNGEIEV